jgi:MFS family permease
MPVVEVVRHYPRQILVVIGARLAENGLGYLFPVFALSYLTKNLEVPKATALTALMLAHGLSLATIPLFSALSDRIGRRPVYAGAALFSAAFAFPFFLLVESRLPVLIGIAMILAISVGVAGMFGPQAAYFAELFGARLRYSGFALARELGSLLAGGLTPFLSAWLVVQMDGAPWGVAGYIVVMSLVTAAAVYAGPETCRLDLADDRVGDARDRPA